MMLMWDQLARERKCISSGPIKCTKRFSSFADGRTWRGITSRRLPTERHAPFARPDLTTRSRSAADEAQLVSECFWGVVWTAGLLLVVVVGTRISLTGIVLHEETEVVLLQLRYPHCRRRLRRQRGGGASYVSSMGVINWGSLQRGYFYGCRSRTPVSSVGMLTVTLVVSWWIIEERRRVVVSHKISKPNPWVESGGKTRDYEKNVRQAYRRVAAETVARKPIEHFLH